MRKTRGIGVLAALALAVAGCGGRDEGTAGRGGAGDGATVELAAQGGSGQSGTATLSAAGGSTRVVIELANGTSTPQPAHIHEGSCANLDPSPAYGLANVVDGRSETTVDVSLADLQKKAYAVNVHKSADEADVYVSCGDVGGYEHEEGEEEPGRGGGYGY
jgi:hypothetical protein